MTTTTAEGVGFRSERGPILIALMLSTWLVAIDSTIVATAVPSIVHDIGGFTSVPLAVLGLPAGAGGVGAGLRRSSPTSSAASRSCCSASACSCSARSSADSPGACRSLIAFRAVQGLGAGAVQPMAITIAGDIYTLAERAKVQGYLASVWAISVGGRADARRRVLRSTCIWRWIFFVNIPLCLLAGVDADPAVPREGRARVKHRIDYLGAVAAHGSAAPCSSSACSRVGRPGPGTPPPASPCSPAARVLLAVFVARRAAGGRAGAAAVGVHPPGAGRRQR